MGIAMELLSYLLLGLISAGCYSLVASTVWEANGQLMNADLQDIPISPYLVQLQHSIKLGVDEAAINAQNALPTEFQMYMQYDMCHNCPLLFVDNIHGKTNKSFAVNTASAVNISLVTKNNLSDIIFTIHQALVEHGQYTLNISLNGNNGTQIDFIQENSPLDANIPIYTAMALFFFLAVSYKFGEFLIKRYGSYFNRYNLLIQDQGQVSSDLGASAEAPEPPPTKQRLKSLDTFRGIRCTKIPVYIFQILIFSLSLVIMIFVNYKGGKYWFFHHSAWNGITVADLVFPWFTFIMGTSIALAFRSMLTRGKSRKSLALKVLKRTAILFFLGLLVSNGGAHAGVHFDTIRIPGVLQRLALSYFAVAMMEVFFAKAGDPYQDKWWSPVRDILPFWAEWIICLCLVSLHLSLTFLLKVPGCPTGYLGPGGIEDNSSNANCTGGAAGYIDRQLFGDGHIYGHPTCTVLYQTEVPYDPEGFLGTLTSIFMCFLGLQAGKVLLYFPAWPQRIKRWLIWAVVTGVIAGVLCKFSQNDGWIPVNKNLWSVSFVLSLASMAYVLLTVCYLVVDVAKVWGGAPFIFPGMNSIVVYLCSEILQSYFPVQFVVSNTHAALLAMHMYGASVWTIMAAVMYYKKTFIAI